MNRTRASDAVRQLGEPPWSSGPSRGATTTGAAVSAPPTPAMSTVETLTSTLFFLSDRVYKLRKPLHLGYADLRGREAREAACQAEIVRNRALAPGVYLGIADIRDGAGAPLDHMVVMRRLPAGRRLSALVARGERLDEPLRAVARMLAAFHEQCETSAEIGARGRLPALEETWLAALEGIAPFRATLLDAAVVDEIGRLALRYLRGREALFDGRVAAGRIRDGHGALVADHVFCLDDGPRILDRVEFDQRLRMADVLADAAVLALDLDLLGAPAAARRFLDWYREFSGESHPPSLEHFYLALRAVIRAGNAAVREHYGEESAAAESRRLAQVALDHLRRARVRLVLLGGAPGTRRVAVAERLAAAEDGWVLLASDRIRGELAVERERQGQEPRPGSPGRFTEDGRSAHRDGPAGGPAAQGAAPVRDAGPAPGEAEPAEPGEVGEAGLFGSDDDVHAELLRRARESLGRAESVIAEARWSNVRYRSEAENLAAETSTDLVELSGAGAALSLEEAVRRGRRAAGIGT